MQECLDHIQQRVFVSVQELEESIMTVILERMGY